MELSYKARYYNGYSAKPHTVDFSFTDSGLQISYTDEAGNFKQEIWLTENIQETEFSAAIVTLRHGNQFPQQQLDVTDRSAIERYRQEYKPHKLKQWIHFRSGRLLVILIGGFILSVALSYFYLLPFMADQVAQRFPKDMEVSLGDEMYASILQQSAIDSAKTESINHFFKQLTIKSEYPVRITVIKDSVVNAFAVPGGGIVVYDAILKNMKEPEALAALLAHEYSHVALKHATRNVFRNIAGYLFVSILFSDVNGIAALVIQNAETLRTLKYSRDLELEADANGLEILKQNNLSSKGMVQLFEQLKKEESMAVNELLSTHPELDTRIDFAKKFSKENPIQPTTHDSLQFYFNQLQSDTSW